MNSMENFNFIRNEDEQNYHALSMNGEYMSSHLLRDFRESPLLYHKKVTGQIKTPDTPAMMLGRAAHKLILQGKNEFDNEYFVSDGPVNPKTGECFGRMTKAYREWERLLPKKSVSNKEFALLEKLESSVRNHPIAKEFLSQGIAEGVVRQRLFEVPCQIRMDFFHPDHGIMDLKTCESLASFHHDCRKYEYVCQMAFYQSVLYAACGCKHPAYLIAVEKNEPYNTGVWYLPPETMMKAVQINADALKYYRKLRNSNLWPTGYENIRSIEFF